MATLQIIEAAIDTSKTTDSIVHISALELRQAGVSYQAAHDALFLECEGDTESDGIEEFWGQDIDGNTWRVHLHR